MDQFITEQLPILKALKRPTELQQLLIALAELPNRSVAESRKMTALVKMEQANQRAIKAKEQVQALLRDEAQRAKTAERKARNHRLIQQGLLFELVGLENRSPAELAGALQALAQVQDGSKWEQWQRMGQQLLNTSAS